MKFEITKNKFGALYFSSPIESHFSDYDIRIDNCRRIAEKELDWISIEQLEREIEAINKAGYEYMICIIGTIAEICYENNSPMMLEGEEAGSILMYLLGATNVSPEQINYSNFSSEYFISKLNKGEFNISIRYCADAEGLIINLLNSKYEYVEVNDGIYERISFIKDRSLNNLAKIRQQTRVRPKFDKYNFANYFTDMYQELHDATFEFKFNTTLNEYQITLEELLRLSGYSHSAIEDKSSHPLFSDVKRYVFRDDFYDEFTKLLIPNEKAIELASKGIWRCHKKDSLEYLKDYSISPNCHFCYESFEQVWSRATTLSRLNIAMELEWYKKEYPKIYKSIVK